MSKYETESGIQCALIEYSRLQALTGTYPELAYLFAIPNGLIVAKKTRRRAVNEGLLPGASDLCLPVARGGYHGLFMELKREREAYGNPKTARKAVSAVQRAFLTFVNSQGYKGVVAYGYDEAIGFLIQYLNNL